MQLFGGDKSEEHGIDPTGDSDGLLPSSVSTTVKQQVSKKD